jgi:hypothetical protein
MTFAVSPSISIFCREHFRLRGANLKRLAKQLVAQSAARLDSDPVAPLTAQPAIAEKNLFLACQYFRSEHFF